MSISTINNQDQLQKILLLSLQKGNQEQSISLSKMVEEIKADLLKSNLLQQK